MKLTDTHLILLSAAARDEAHLLPRPDRIACNAAQALAGKLIRAGLVQWVPVRSGQPHWRVENEAPVGLQITCAGLAALGLDEPAEVSAPALGRDTRPQPARAPRAGSKQAAVLDLLGREQGATLADLTGATGWLAHTTRAALTGLRQRGYALARSRDENGRTIYRIRPESEALHSGGEG
jgi:hypothetical protein